MDLSMYISNEYYLVVVLLYALGTVIKKYMTIPNCCIPLILSTIGIITCVIMVYTNTGKFDITSVIQGLMCGLTAVGTNQIIKQTVENANLSKSNNDIEN